MMSLWETRKVETVHAYYFTTLGEISSPAIIRLRHPYDISEGDYVIISHPDFIEAISPLVCSRQQQGHRVSKINVRTIYDKYGYGKPVPEAITVFLESAYHNWSTFNHFTYCWSAMEPAIRKTFSGSFETFIPPYLVDVDPWQVRLPADNRFVTVDPPDDEEDILPDMLIGRLPVNSVGELNSLYQKLSITRPILPQEIGGKTITTVTDDPDYPGHQNK